MTTAALSLGKRTVSRHRPALVVAEIGQNHNGSRDEAEELIDMAAWAGADAVKLTKRDLDWDLCREARQRPYLVPHAFGSTYGEHRAALELSPADHAALARRIRRHGLTYLATACDPPSADLLVSLGVDGLKIASRDLANLPLLAHVARLGRPLILSTGMSAWSDIEAAVALLRAARAEFLFLQCTSLYPTPWEHAHLASLPALAERTQTLVGFSDHTPGTLLAPVAVALGARVIEKHVTLDRGHKGTDHACSLEPEQFRQMIMQIRQVEAALGSAEKPVAPGIDHVRQKLGRSLVSRVPVPAGTPLVESMLMLKCPGEGLAWQDRGRVLGRRALRDIAPDELIREEDWQAPEVVS